MLPHDPNPDAVKTVKDRLRARLSGGALLAGLAEETRIEAGTLGKFIRIASRRPSRESWPLLREWYATQVGRPAKATREPPPIYQVKPKLDALEDAEREEREVLSKLSHIYGRMESMTEQIESLLMQHKRITNRFAPWAQREASAAFGSLLERVRTEEYPEDDEDGPLDEDGALLPRPPKAPAPSPPQARRGKR